MGIYDEYKAPEQQGLYFKFEEGVANKVRLASEPVVYEETFPRGEETRVSTKYAWVIWNDTLKIAQVLRMPITGFKKIQATAKDPDWGDPEMYSFNITRTGTGLDTEYSIVPVPVKCTLAELDEAAPEAVKKVDLIRAIESGNGVEHVNWLKDVVKGGTRSNQLKAEDFPPADSKDVVIEDIDDKPIDLSEIPF